MQSFAQKVECMGMLDQLLQHRDAMLQNREQAQLLHQKDAADLLDKQAQHKDAAELQLLQQKDAIVLQSLEGQKVEEQMAVRPISSMTKFSSNGENFKMRCD